MVLTEFVGSHEGFLKYDRSATTESFLLPQNEQNISILDPSC